MAADSAAIRPTLPPHGALPRGERLRLWTTLMCHAPAGDTPEVQAMAGVLATAWSQHGLGWLPLTDLDAADTRQLLAHWFPGVDRALALDWLALAGAVRPEPRRDEIEDLVSLLTTCAGEAGSPCHAEDRWLAHALAQATLGQDHLWQDLHLPSRRELSALMQARFPRLAARNDRDMKWKKFLYKQLCDLAEISLCRAPSCGVCTDQALCFGPEEVAAPVQPLR